MFACLEVRTYMVMGETWQLLKIRHFHIAFVRMVIAQSLCNQLSYCESGVCITLVISDDSS